MMRNLLPLLTNRNRTPHFPHPQTRGGGGGSNMPPPSAIRPALFLLLAVAVALGGAFLPEPRPAAACTPRVTGLSIFPIQIGNRTQYAYAEDHGSGNGDMMLLFYHDVVAAAV